MREITTKHNSNHRKYRCELVEEPKKQVNRIFIDEKLAIKVTMDCRTTLAHKFRTTIGFKQCNVILTKGVSVLTKIMNSFEEENMKTQYKVFSYRTDLYFHDYKLPIETDEDRHRDRNIDYEIKKQK